MVVISLLCPQHENSCFTKLSHLHVSMWCGGGRRAATIRITLWCKQPSNVLRTTMTLKKTNEIIFKQQMKQYFKFTYTNFFA